MTDESEQQLLLPLLIVLQGGGEPAPSEEITAERIHILGLVKVKEEQA